MIEIIMPKMGDGMTEGTVIAWLKNVGDTVKKGDALLEIETDKASTEVAAKGDGVLSQIVVPVGQTVPVGTVIGSIGGAVESATEEKVKPPSSKPDDKQEEIKPGASGSPPGDGKNGKSNGQGHGANGDGGRVIASPLAKSMARERSLNLARVPGTGPGGRIVKRDLLAYLETHGEQEIGEQTELTQVSGDVAARLAELERLNAELNARLIALGDSGLAGVTPQEIATSKMRKAIAARTVQSKQNIPHFYVTMLIEMDRALALLKELNVNASEGKVTVNDIIVKACARSLARVPEVNATWTPENAIRRYAEAHIGIAVGIDDGLIIPVVRDCHKKTLREISVEAKQLITRARSGQLKPEEYSGGTFSVSNLGMMGVDEFIAIINPPEAAILAIGGISRDSVVTDENDNLEIRSRMKVTISADHRLLDGVVAARFLQEVKKALESPFSLLS